MRSSYLWGIVGQRSGRIGHSRAEKGLKREYSRVKKAFQCTRTMGVSAPSLHRESTDSLISFTVQELKTLIVKASDRMIHKYLY